jgi:hypothetical protein
MRNLFLDLALSTGLEELSAPPVSDVGPSSTTDLIVAETELARATTLVTQSDADVSEAKSNLADLTRLANGLEGLMIEVAQVENPAGPSEDELAALRVSAMAVRREFLSRDQRRVVDDIAEGRLEGSVEGLGDVIKNISTKLGFAIGNFWDGAKRTITTGKQTTQRADAVLVDLTKRIQAMPDVEYSAKVDKGQALAITMGKQVDLKGSLADIVPATDDWFRRTVNLLVDKIGVLSTDIEAVLKTTTEEEFKAAIAATLPHLSVPMPDSVGSSASVVNGKYFTFDVFDIHESASGRTLASYVARPERNAQIDSQYFDVANAVGVSFMDMCNVRKPTPTPTTVTLTKAEMLNGLAQLRQAVGNIDAYLNQMDVVYKAYSTYQTSIRPYDAFIKNAWVTKNVQAQVSAHAGAILSLFEMTILATSGTLALITDIAGIIKTLVYSSDLS